MCKHMYFAVPEHFPFAAQRTDQGCIFIDTQHAFAFLELRLQRKSERLEHHWNGIEMRQDELGRYDPEAFIGTSQTKAWDTFGKDHRARRTTRIDAPIAPRLLPPRPRARALP